MKDGLLPDGAAVFADMVPSPPYGRPPVRARSNKKARRLDIEDISAARLSRGDPGVFRPILADG